MTNKEGHELESTSSDKLLSRVDSGIHDLLSEMQQGRSERLERYLEFTSRFHRYSPFNQLLILQQCPQATRVASYRKWQELGYQVRRGERAIRIYAPRPYSHQVPETGELEQRVYFVPVPVFDSSQLANLDEKPLPTFFTPLPDDQNGLYRRLVEVVRASGVQVSEEPLANTQGYSAGGRIAIRTGLDSRSQLLTLLHEYAHELLHWKPAGKANPIAIKECHAEAVSYVVAHHFGIHNPFSADYLQHWGTTPKELFAELEVVSRTSAYIIDRLESQPEAGSEQAE